MQKTRIITILVLVALLAVGGIIFSQLSYKICWRCSADEYFIRGAEYACNDKKSYRQTGLEFIKNAAGQGHIKAELALAELYCNDLPKEYLISSSQQKVCLRQDVTPDQTTGVSYFESVIGAVEQGQEVDHVTLNNLALLYFDGIVAADDHVGKAVRLFEKAAAAGSFPAMMQLGKLANDKGYYSKAMQWFVQASEDSADFSSPLMVGDYYLYGKGAALDYKKAEEWYNKARIRAGKADKGAGDAQSLIEEVSLARLDMVKRKIEEQGVRTQRVAISYHIEGGVKHFVIFAADRPEEHIGEVFNDNGSIYAAMNENLEFASLLPESRQENFSSMNEGMRWVLTTFAMNTHEDAAEVIFDFVLTKS